MSDRKISIWSLVISILSLFAALFFGLRTEGLLRFEEWDYNKILSFSSIVQFIAALIVSVKCYKRYKREMLYMLNKHYKKSEKALKKETEQIMEQEEVEKKNEEVIDSLEEIGTQKEKEGLEVEETQEEVEKKNEESVFETSMNYFHPDKYHVRVKYKGDSSDSGIMVSVKVPENDICKLLNGDDLTNVYLKVGGSFVVELQKTQSCEEHNSCFFIRWDKDGCHSEIVKFDTNKHIII